MSYHHVSDVLRDLDALIAKYEAIPAEKWTVGDYVNDTGCCCALGHLGVRSDPSKDYRTMMRTPESDAVAILLSVYNRSLGDLVAHNDDLCCLGREILGPGAGPKDRVLNFLKSLRKRTPAV